MRTTQTEARKQMSLLRSCNAGPLRGIPRTRYTAPAIDTSQLPPTCATQLRAGLADWDSDRTGPETAVYVVTSDRLPIVWLTSRATIQTPQMPLSASQERHQRLAVEALTCLSRQVLRGLADARDDADPTRHAADGERSEHTLGALRVASRRDPTHTVWVWPTADADQTRHRIRDLLHDSYTDTDTDTDTDVDEPLVISARGYGRYGSAAPIIDLDVVCAIQRLTDTHPVTATAVGNWIVKEGGRSARIDPTQLIDVFETSFHGLFKSPAAYTWHRVIRQGWMQALTTAGIDAGFFHTDA